MWKHGLASGMVSWNSNVPFDDITSYADEMYFDSENGYSSCYVVKQPKRSQRQLGL